MTTTDESPNLGLLPRIIEWWSLRTMEARAIAIGDDERKRIAAALDEAREHRRAAEILFMHDLVPRALHEAQLACDQLTRIATANAPSNTSSFPRTDRDVTKAHRELFGTLCETHEELEEQLTPSAISIARLRSLRVERRLLVAAVLIGLLIAIAWLGLRNTVRATASGHVGHNNAAKAIDLKADVPWLLPPNEKGWLDLTPSSARTVARVRLCTAMGGNAARVVRLDFFRAGAVVKTIETTLEAAGALYPEWKSVDVGESNIERVRLSVLSWYGDRGGIGEIELE